MWEFHWCGRPDKHNLVDNAIFSPRLNLRYNPTENVNLRLTYSEGFRAPQIFDENLHVDIAGGEQIIRVLSDNLKEERSRSISGSVDMYHQVNNNSILNLLLRGSIQTEQSFYRGATGMKFISKTSFGAMVYGVNQRKSGIRK